MTCWPSVNQVLLFELIPILSCKNDLICLMMSCMFYLFSLQVFEKSGLEIWGFIIFSELAVLDWFLTWQIKHSKIPVRTYVLSFESFRLFCLNARILRRTDTEPHKGPRISPKLWTYIIPNMDCVFFNDSV